ncbi:MAG: TetR family transcriptional regulator [Rhodobacteraceae bacterium HLUCCA08]|nr:MAG: TetR family transcriptional regulator [Rhodobacteraceae bacterium HLUCCA08]
MPCHVVDKGAKVTWEQVLRHGADAAPFAWTLAEGARGGNRGRHDQVGIDDNRRAVDQAAGRRADRRRRGSASGHPLPGGRRPVESRRDLPKDMSPIRKTNRRNPEITRAAIRQAARQAFSDLGLSGARVDRIAERAGVSKPKIDDCSGDRHSVHAAALRKAEVRIRRVETRLDLATR